MIEWIRNWLSGRRQRVVMGTVISDWIEVLSGVPQGSVLGPVLFLVYINDLSDNLSSVTKLNADDNKLICVLSDDQSQTEILQSHINKMVDWSKMWKLYFYCDECKIMHFGKNNRQHDYLPAGNFPGRDP